MGPGKSEDMALTPQARLELVNALMAGNEIQGFKQGSEEGSYVCIILRKSDPAIGSIECTCLPKNQNDIPHSFRMNEKGEIDSHDATTGFRFIENPNRLLISLKDCEPMDEESARASLNTYDEIRILARSYFHANIKELGVEPTELLMRAITPRESEESLPLREPQRNDIKRLFSGVLVKIELNESEDTSTYIRGDFKLLVMLTRLSDKAKKDQGYVETSFFITPGIEFEEELESRLYDLEGLQFTFTDTETGEQAQAVPRYLSSMISLEKLKYGHTYRLSLSEALV